MLYAPGAARTLQEVVLRGTPLMESVSFHALALVCLRLLLFQAWRLFLRLPSIARYQIQSKGIKRNVPPTDDEANWWNVVFVTTFIILMGTTLAPPSRGLPAWDGWGMAIAFIMHVGPVEFLFYWTHRAFHYHKFPFTHYHHQHHLSYADQPISSGNHHPVEQLVFGSVLSIAYLVPSIMGHSSIGLLYVFILSFDFFNLWGHSNIEFIPTWVFDAMPSLKYIIFSPTFHTLHHTKLQKNFSLYIPFYDYIYGTFDDTLEKFHHDVRKRIVEGK